MALFFVADGRPIVGVETATLALIFGRGRNKRVENVEVIERTNSAAPWEDLATLVLYFTKGLGDVVADEATRLVPAANVARSESRYHFVTAPRASIPVMIENLRTVDDIRILVAGSARISGPEDLGALCEVAASRAREVIAGDLARTESSWSITISAVSPTWRRSPVWDPAPVIAEHLGNADVQARSRAPVDFRLQVDGQDAHVSLSLSDVPIGKRDRNAGYPGALRPSVAAALVRIGIKNLPPSIVQHGVYDPFAGTGTIVGEAWHLGLPIYASDISKNAIELTRKRLASMLKPLRDDGVVGRHPERTTFVHDVRHGKPPHVGAKILVTNMPWGKQVKIGDRRELIDAVIRLVTEVASRGGRSILLTTDHDQLVRGLQQRHPRLKVSRRVIGLLGQTPSIVEVNV